MQNLESRTIFVVRLSIIFYLCSIPYAFFERFTIVDISFLFYPNISCLYNACTCVCVCLHTHQSSSALARWQERTLCRVSRNGVCWQLLSVCWSGVQRSPPPLGASGSEEGLVRFRVSTEQKGDRKSSLFSSYSPVIIVVHSCHMGHDRLENTSWLRRDP